MGVGGQEGDMMEEDLTVATYVRPTTLRALRDAGIVLSEVPSMQARLRVTCEIVSYERHENHVHVGFAVEIERTGGAWENIMADLTPSEDDEANIDRVQRLFGATGIQARAMVFQVQQVAAEVRAAKSVSRERKSN